MKPLESTLCLINYQWWCAHTENIIGVISEHHLHIDGERFRNGCDQAIYAAGRAKEWHLKWMETFYDHNDN
jgi:hypothetical protein